MKTAARFDNFPPYTPIEPYDVLSARLGIPADQIVKLDANENPYGMSPRAAAALADVRDAHIYPDPESRALRAALAGHTGLPADNLMAGAGADELIDLILRVMIEPGDAVFNFPPTFGMYPFGARLNGADLVEIPRRADFSLDIQALLEQAAAKQPRVIFLTSPNNPDGRLITEAEFEAVISLPTLVVLDEAYIEFSGAGLGRANTRMAQVPERENLCVLRTFSKWAGLAGLRVGYGAFPAWLMPVLWKAKQPYNVNVAAAQAAIASLEDTVFLQTNVERITAERARLQKFVSAMRCLTPLESSANFILCRVNGLPAAELKTELMRQGILVRYYDTPLLRESIRISVGRPQDTDRLMQVLYEIDEKRGERA